MAAAQPAQLGFGTGSDPLLVQRHVLQSGKRESHARMLPKISCAFLLSLSCQQGWPALAAACVPAGHTGLSGLAVMSGQWG